MPLDSEKNLLQLWQDEEMLQAEQGSREASRGAADWLADEGKLLEDGFPLKFWLGWKRSWLLRQAEEAVFPLKAG